MQLSKRTEYGLRAIVQLAKLPPNQFVQSRDLAKQENLPNKFLEAILLALKRGGFLESKVGSGGGYCLSRPANEINVGDLVRRLEGRLSARDTATPKDMAPGETAVFLINERLTTATDDALAKMTLEDLVTEVGEHSKGQQEMYYI